MRLDAFEVQLDANRRLFVDGETVSMTLEIGEFGLGKELNLRGLRIKDEEIWSAKSLTVSTSVSESFPRRYLLSTANKPMD